MSKSPGKKPLDTSHLQIPPESKLLRAAYEESGVIVSSLSRATDISTPAIYIAVNGFRYRKGVPTVVSPPDKTLVKLAAVLRIEPEALRNVGRDHAAKLLEEIPADELPTAEDSENLLESVAMPPGRQILARQVLGVFSTDELRAEIERREAKLADDEIYSDDADDSDDTEFHAELADDLRAEQWPGK